MSLFKKKALERNHKEETVESLGEQVTIREMSVRDRLQAFSEARVEDKFDSALLCFTVLVRSAYQGAERVFEDHDAHLLANAPFDADIDDLASVALRVNGLSGGSMETAEKN